MTATLRRDAIDVKGILQRLHDKRWTTEPYGDDSVKFHGPSGQLIIVSFDPDSDDSIPWLHASTSHLAESRLPSYSDIKQMAQAVWPDGYCYQVFAPADDHVNITRNVLHLWGRADGAMVLPDFARLGTI
jgi:hypothetical protein